MDALALDPAGYDGTYKLVGGRVSLDFVNTVSWPHTDRRHDWLSSPTNVTAWLDAVGLGAEMVVSDEDLEAIHQIRAVIGEVVSPLAHGTAPAARAVEQLNTILFEVSPTRKIDPVTLSWTWTSPASPLDLFRSVVTDAADVATSGPTERLKHCPSCDWIFEDQTRNGRRRWCDMADCGSRAKSRTYYNRTRTRN